MFFDYWLLEFMTLVSGIISLKCQVTQVLLINVFIGFTIFGVALQSAATAVVGNNIGRGDAANAKKYFHAVLIVSCSLFLILAYIA
jgi:Na+-driven multidrug efflux pump